MPGLIIEFGFKLRDSVCLAGAFLIGFVCFPARAQETQFLPEVDANLTLNSAFRAYLQAKDDREGGDPTQFSFGPSLQFYRKPLIKLKKVTAFDLDDSKSRLLVLETGYRYITAPNAPPETRLVEAATSNFPLNAGFLVTDRNRFDLDWKNKVFSWRYRNRLTLERTVAIRAYHFIPYVAAEPLRESVQQVEHHISLRGFIVPRGQTRRIQHILRARQQHRQAPEPASELAGVGPLSLLFRGEEMNQLSPKYLIWACHF
jgi:hypothetical protein